MTAPSAAELSPRSTDDEISILVLGSALLRGRRTIVAFAAIGAIIGVVAGFLTPRTYTSGATFLPQGAEGGSSALTAAASQFGLRVPTGGVWGPPLYVKLLTSRALLEPIATDTISVPELNGRSVTVADLLGVTARTPEARADQAVRALRRTITSSEVKTVGAVDLKVTTEWASVSRAIAERLLAGVNKFNVRTRQSQATAERGFVQAQASMAEARLRDAENRLQSFLQRNRAIDGFPALGFDRDRLQREVALRQQIYASLVQSLEEARIREVRDIPVITILERPQLPLRQQRRGPLNKGLIGGVIGSLIGLVVALTAEGLRRGRLKPNRESEEFFGLMHEATPRPLRRFIR